MRECQIKLFSVSLQDDIQKFCFNSETLNTKIENVYLLAVVTQISVPTLAQRSFLVVSILVLKIDNSFFQPNFCFLVKIPTILQIRKFVTPLELSIINLIFSELKSSTFHDFFLEQIFFVRDRTNRFTLSLGCNFVLKTKKSKKIIRNCFHFASFNNMFGKSSSIYVKILRRKN